MQQTTVRVAAKAHLCSDDANGRHYINRGESYAEHIASPDHDGLGNTHWWRLRECGACYERRMGKLLGTAAEGGER